MRFEQVIGQDSVKEHLIDSVRLERVSHAQMFLGAAGFGGLPLALAYAQYINCEAPTDKDSCGLCSACVKAQKLIHPDIHFSFPFPNIEKKRTSNEFLTEWREVVLADPYLELGTWMEHFNAENKQANIPKEECNEIVRKLSLKTFEGGYKVMIIWLPEYLGKEGNRLLKLIEEPPEKTLFILVAEQLEAILDTIISRTQIVKIPFVAPDALAARLQTDLAINAENALWLADLAGGNYNVARQLNHNEAGEHMILFNSWMKMLLQERADRPQLIKWVDEFAKLGREAQKHFFMYLLHQFRELIQARIRKQPSEILTAEERLLHAEIAGRLNMERLQQVYALFNNGHYYLERNANPKVLMLNMSINMHKLLNRNSLISQNQMVKTR